VSLADSLRHRAVPEDVARASEGGGSTLPDAQDILHEHPNMALVPNAIVPLELPRHSSQNRCLSGP